MEDNDTETKDMCVTSVCSDLRVAILIQIVAVRHRTGFKSIWNVYMISVFTAAAANRLVSQFENLWSAAMWTSLWEFGLKEYHSSVEWGLTPLTGFSVSLTHQQTLGCNVHNDEGEGTKWRNKELKWGCYHELLLDDRGSSCNRKPHFLTCDWLSLSKLNTNHV